MPFSSLFSSAFVSFCTTYVLCFTVGISCFLCVHCFLAKRNKSDREENDKVKNKKLEGGDGSECFMALKPTEVSCKRAVA
jgi:hypothetical protein